jgi:mannose-6-phosphate isomerase-like protein (cupin superfamily)
LHGLTAGGSTAEAAYVAGYRSRQMRMVRRKQLDEDLKEAMMNFSEQTVKGLARCFVDEDLQPERLHIHISELGAGLQSHPPHHHDGVEAFYVLEGEGTLEIDGAQQVIRAGEATVFDPTKLHGLRNTGVAPMRYIVIISREG